MNVNRRQFFVGLFASLALVATLGIGSARPQSVVPLVLEPGHAYFFLAHHGDNAGQWLNFTTAPPPKLADWETKYEAIVLDFKARGLTYEPEPGVEIVNAIVAYDASKGGFKGFPNIWAWSIAQIGANGNPAVRISSRQHDGPYSPADCAYQEELAGIPFNGVLGSFSTTDSVYGDVLPKAYPQAPSRHYTVLVGGTEAVGHTGPPNYPAGITRSPTGQVIVLPGKAVAVPKSRFPVLWRNLQNGTIAMAIGWISGTMSEKAGRPFFSLSADGSPYLPAVDAGMAKGTAAQRAITHFVTQEQIAGAVLAQNLPDFTYREDLLR